MNCLCLDSNDTTNNHNNKLVCVLCVCVQNYVRVVEVWWDEYKDYFYASRPETLTLAYGDISELKRFR